MSGLMQAYPVASGVFLVTGPDFLVFFSIPPQLAAATASEVVPVLFLHQLSG